MYAGVAELADARDSNSRGEILVGSIPTSGINYNIFHNDVPERVSFAYRNRWGHSLSVNGAAFHFEKWYLLVEIVVIK